MRFILLIWALSFCVVVEAKPRIAVWNPETGTASSRFKLDLNWLNQATQWLIESDIETSRVTAEQLQNVEEFSAAKYDALMFPGDAFPRRATLALQKFSDDGGILISLGAGPVPFLIGIEKDSNGAWAPSPVTPDKGWETPDIYGKTLGLVYNELLDRRDDGIHHEATPLLKKYIMVPFDVTTVEKKLPSRWIVPRLGAELFPLIRSHRTDGNDTVPQLFIVRNKTAEGTKTGIIAVSDFFTRPTNSEKQYAKQIVVSLAKIAEDIKSGQLQMSPDEKIDLHDIEQGD